MNPGYIYLKVLTNYFRNESGREFFSALQEKSSQDAYGTGFGLLVCFYLRFLKEKEEGFNFRLVNAFYARIRWDLAVKDVERVDLAEMTKMPVHGSQLYKIILAGRRYIGNVCKELNGGNMLLRRSLMNPGYIYLKVLTNYFRNESGRDFFSALQETSSQDAYGTALGLLSL